MTPQRRARVEDHSIEEGARKFYTRAMAIAIVLVLAASIIAMVRPYLVGRFAASAVVTTGSLDVAFSGKALVIRNERVGITPTSGTLHIVAANGDRVGAGDVVAQVLDPAAAARLTKSGSLLTRRSQMPLPTLRCARSASVRSCRASSSNYG